MKNAERYITIKKELDLLDEKLKRITDAAVFTCISHMGDLSAVAEYVRGLMDTADNYIQELIDISAVEENRPNIVLPDPLRCIEEKNIPEHLRTMQQTLILRRKIFDEAVGMGYGRPNTVIDYNFTQTLINHFKQM